MIRIFSADYTQIDYVVIEKILLLGLMSVRETHCHNRCDSCQYKRVCSSVVSAINYCHKKAEELP